MNNQDTNEICINSVKKKKTQTHTDNAQIFMSLLLNDNTRDMTF